MAHLDRFTRETATGEQEGDETENSRAGGKGESGMKTESKKVQIPKRRTVTMHPHTYQPSKAEKEEDIRWGGMLVALSNWISAIAGRWRSGSNILSSIRGTKEGSSDVCIWHGQWGFKVHRCPRDRHPLAEIPAPIGKP